jgi:hypothetical protein
VADAFSPHMGAVARKFLGDPNLSLSSAAELRFGQHGSLSVDLEKGVWADHEAKTGGGVLDFLVEREKMQKGEALDWLRENVAPDLEDRRVANDALLPKARMVAAYDYVDEYGEVLFQVCRYEPKTFRQRKPDPSSRDGWSWGVKGVRLIPYRLPQIQDAIAKREPVFICEGEKDADNLSREGVAATTCAMGAGKWSDELSQHFAGADVVILPHNDEAGKAHGQQVAASVSRVAKSVRVLDLPNLPPKGDVSNWLEAGGDECELIILSAKAPRWTPERPESRFGAIAWADLDTVAIRQDWLVEDMMFCGDVGMVYGASGSGKSFLTVHMGLCIARGSDFLGKKTRKGGVLYQAGEGGKGLVKRLRAYKQENQITDDLPFVLLPTRLDLFGPDADTDAFITECLAWRAALTEPLSLIVIDTFSTASPGANENASEDMSRLIRAGEAINQATGAALMWVHHKNAAGDRERGHTSLRANIDTAIEVTKDDDSNVRTAKLAKLKDGEDGLKFAFELQSVTVGAYDDGKPMTSCVVVPAQAVTERTGKTRLRSGESTFLKVLGDAVAQYGGQIPGDDQWGVEWEDFRRLYVAVAGQGREAGAIRTALSRDGDALWRADLIGRADRWLWVTPRGLEAR